MASSLRNLGRAEQAAEMLFAELQQPSDELDSAVSAFLALALADLGREREALSLSLGALSTYLPRYNQSLARYAKALHPAERAAQRDRAQCAEPFQPAGTGKAMTSMPSSAKAARSWAVAWPRMPRASASP